MKAKDSTRRCRPFESVVMDQRILRNPKGDLTLGKIPMGRDGEVLREEIELGIIIKGGTQQDRELLWKEAHDEVDRVFEKGIVEVE